MKSPALFAASALLLLVLGLSWQSLFSPLHVSLSFPFLRRQAPSTLESALGLVSNDSLAHFLRAVTQEAHIAGTPADLRTADFVESKLKEFGVKTHTVDFPTLVGYPSRQRVAIVHPPPSQDLPLREASYAEDPFSQDPDASTPFLAYSPSGSVAGEIVYANFGSTEDFARLAAQGVGCQGKVALMRYGELFRGDMVNNAALNGAVGALLYDDPDPYAPNGTSPAQTYPNFNSLPSTGVQRGSILLGTPGDPRTPGWPSCPTCETWSKDELAAKGLLPTIPAVPISYGNAEKILRLLGGAMAPPAWQGGIPGLVYRAGPGPVQVSVEVEGNITVATVRNVVGVVEGSEEPDRYVVVGNHRDAWVFGAADPNSGTACLLEFARILSELRLQHGWQPRRSLVLASWDGEEHNLLGSTEWVELNLPLLQSRAVAYLNSDVAVAGPGLYAAATPSLDEFVRRSASRIQDPDTAPGQSLLDTWPWRGSNGSVPLLGRLGGGGSDFAAFLQHAGIASTDTFLGGDYPMYHSVYDNFHWMAKFGDPGFKRHVASTQLLLVMALSLGSDHLLPFDYTSYTEEFELGLQGLQAALQGTGAPDGVLLPLAKALESFRDAADGAKAEREELLLKEQERGCQAVQGRLSAWALRNINDRLMLAERGLLDPQGLNPNASWFKHLVYGPTTDNDYGTDMFPSIQSALSSAVSTSNGAGVLSMRNHTELPPKPLSMPRTEQPYIRRRSLRRPGPGTGLGAHKAAEWRTQGKLDALSDAKEGGGDWAKLEHEIFRVSRALQRSAAILKGQLV